MHMIHVQGERNVENNKIWNGFCRLSFYLVFLWRGWKWEYILLQEDIFMWNINYLFKEHFHFHTRSKLTVSGESFRNIFALYCAITWPILTQINVNNMPCTTKKKGERKPWYVMTSMTKYSWKFTIASICRSEVDKKREKKGQSEFMKIVHNQSRGIGERQGSLWLPSNGLFVNLSDWIIFLLLPMGILLKWTVVSRWKDKMQRSVFW